MKKRRNVGEEIKRLRGPLSQKAFADQLGLQQNTISAWELGAVSPSAEAWIKLGNLAGYPDCMWFWAQAGMKEDLMLSASAKQLKQIGERPPEVKVAAVPPLDVLDQLSDKKIRDLWYVDARYIPTDSFPSYYVVGDTLPEEDLGITRGTVILLETSIFRATIVGPLWDQPVLIDVAEEDRKSFQFPPHRGLHIGWLHLATGEAGGVRYAVLDPHRESTHDFTPYQPGDAIAFGRWSGTPSDDLQKKYFASEGKMTEWELWDAAAKEQMQLFPGCTILGRVLGWFVPTGELSR